MSDFDRAVEDSRKLEAKPSDNELLEVCSEHFSGGTVVTLASQLYGLFKVGSGENIADSEAPGTFDFKVRSAGYTTSKVPRS